MSLKIKDTKEQVIYSDDNVKLTPTDIHCNGRKYSIIDIEDVGSDLKIIGFNFWLVLMILSFVPLYWYTIYVLTAFSVLTFFLSLICLMITYKKYSILYITIKGEKHTILTASMNKREYIYKIAEELAKVVIEIKDLAAKKDMMKESVPSYINPTLTLLLRMVNEQDREELKKIAKEAQEQEKENAKEETDKE